MTYTSHGHHIPDSPTDDETEIVRVARCGGPGLCASCSTESGKWAESRFLQDAVNRVAMTGRMGHTESIKAARYQTKPAEIVAVQYKGGASDGLDIVTWIKSGGGNATYTAPQPPLRDGDFTHPEIFETIMIETDSGWSMAYKDWWIITTGVNATFYPCPPDVFPLKYELKE